MKLQRKIINCSYILQTELERYFYGLNEYKKCNFGPKNSNFGPKKRQFFRKLKKKININKNHLKATSVIFFNNLCHFKSTKCHIFIIFGPILALQSRILLKLPNFHNTKNVGRNFRILKIVLKIENFIVFKDLITQNNVCTWI